MAKSIPIRNLYYLFLYAWGLFPEGKSVEAGAISGPDLLDLFARVLANGVRRLLRRGPDRGYLEVAKETAAPRGRFLLTDTLKKGVMVRGRAVCAFDELTPDVPHNRVLKATLRTLADAKGLNTELAHDLRLLHRRLVGVADLPLSCAIFRPVQLSRNSRHYGLLMRVCELILGNLLPGEGEHQTRFADILEDEAQMSTVFEAFVRNFYREEQDAFAVAAEQVAWDVVCAEPWQARYLPTMRTDVTLRSPERTIVMDAKFYRKTLVNYMGGTEKVRSAHLYQLLTYLRHIQPVSEAQSRPEGVLLYPRIDGLNLRMEYLLGGYRVRVCTLALDLSWSEIHAELLAILGPVSD
jgi:5-methylcytosine-specific restriction enzyme subunit McrC